MMLTTLRTYALTLPEVTEQPHFQFGSWRVRGKIFVTLPPGDTHIHVFVSESVREEALAMYPEFVEKLFWGDKVVGLRVALVSAPAATVKRLVHQAWRGKAPKGLAT
jgi:hypothetical protein